MAFNAQSIYSLNPSQCLKAEHRHHEINNVSTQCGFLRMGSRKGAHLQLGDLLLHLFLHGLPQAVGALRLVSLAVHVQLSLLQCTPAAAAHTCGDSS